MAYAHKTKPFSKQPSALLSRLARYAALYSIGNASSFPYKRPMAHYFLMNAEKLPSVSDGIVKKPKEQWTPRHIRFSLRNAHFMAKTQASLSCLFMDDITLIVLYHGPWSNKTIM